MVARAFATATSGCPGPVLVSVPLDLYSTFVESDAPLPGPRAAPSRGVRADAAQIRRAVDLLAAASRPLLFAGGGVIRSGASEELTRLAEHLAAPVATTMSGQGAISLDHALAAGFTGTVGTPTANRLAREADVILAVGTRFPEMDCNSWRPEHFWRVPPARLIHLDIEPDEIGKIYDTEVPLVGDAKATLAEMVADAAARVPAREPEASAWLRSLHDERAAWRRELEEIQMSAELPMQPARVLREVREILPRDGIFVSGVGVRHAVGQHFPTYVPRTLIIGSGFGTMGQEMPAPLGAKIARPDRPVVAVVGDGAFHSVPQAVGVAVAHDIPVVWVVLNNRGYASIAVYQNKHYGRLHATYFEGRNGKSYYPDTVAVARAYGAEAVRAERPEELAAALRAALAGGRPTVIDVLVTDRPRIRASGHWDVNDILAAGIAR
jgi:acetolactate synthase-1/2/3 large subunit